MDHIVISTVNHDAHMVKSHDLTPILELLSRTLGGMSYAEIKKYMNVELMDDLVEQVRYLSKIEAIETRGAFSDIHITKYGVIILAMINEKIEISETKE